MSETYTKAEKATQAMPQKPVMSADDVMHYPPFSMPISEFLSPEAKKNSFKSSFTTIEAWEERLKRVIAERLELFPATITPRVIGDIQANVIEPKSGIAESNKTKLLINLHSGGFMSGTISDTGLLESVPIASVGKIRVITVEYRYGPAHKFPAASEDVASVYRSLLNDYRPMDIGIYGCSAGGILTAEAIAWFQKHQLPCPGAAGIFGAGALAATKGDAYYTTFMSSLIPAMPAPDGIEVSNTMAGYFGDTDIRDPLASPVYSSSILREFPPTLVLTSTRDQELSGAVYTHGQLIKAGVDADLHVWDGMGHCFFNYYEDQPESREAYDVIAKFFARHLGKG